MFLKFPFNGQINDLQVLMVAGYPTSRRIVSAKICVTYDIPITSQRTAKLKLKWMTRKIVN
jgi:hypothetical protein